MIAHVITTIVVGTGDTFRNKIIHVSNSKQILSSAHIRSDRILECDYRQRWPTATVVAKKMYLQFAYKSLIECGFFFLNKTSCSQYIAYSFQWCHVLDKDAKKNDLLLFKWHPISMEYDTSIEYGCYIALKLTFNLQY